jgi:Ca-activated chloride channel family protein
MLRNAIEQHIHASGGTYIGSGLEMGIQLLKNRQTSNPLGAILLLTDGQDNQHHNYSTLMEALPDGVVCHTFGYGSDHKASLLSQLAEQGHGGTFTYIDQVDAIGPAFATALGGLFTCIAKQLRIKLEFNDDYKITHTHTTYQYEPNTLPSRQITFKMTDLNADESRNLVFQLRIPKIEPSDENNSNDQTIGKLKALFKNLNHLISFF